MCDWSNAGHREEMKKAHNSAPLWAAWAEIRCFYFSMLGEKGIHRTVCGVQYLVNFLPKCQRWIWPQSGLKSTCFSCCSSGFVCRPPVYSVASMEAVMSSESEPEYFIYPLREAAEGKAFRMCTLAQILISVTFLFLIIRFRTNRNAPGGFCQSELLPSAASKWDH